MFSSLFVCHFHFPRVHSNTLHSNTPTKLPGQRGAVFGMWPPEAEACPVWVLLREDTQRNVSHSHSNKRPGRRPTEGSSH